MIHLSIACLLAVVSERLVGGLEDAVLARVELALHALDNPVADADDHGPFERGDGDLGVLALALSGAVRAATPGGDLGAVSPAGEPDCLDLNGLLTERADLDHVASWPSIHSGSKPRAARRSSSRLAESAPTCRRPSLLTISESSSSV